MHVISSTNKSTLKKCHHSCVFVMTSSLNISFIWNKVQTLIPLKGSRKEKGAEPQKQAAYEESLTGGAVMRF